MPGTFKEGVAQLEELHKKVHHQKDVAENQRLEAGRLCNEIAGYFTPIDKAADDGKKEETQAISKKLGEAISQLKGLDK